MNTLKSGHSGIQTLRVEDKNPYASKLVLIIDSVPEMQRALSMTLASFGANKVEYAMRAGDALSKLGRFDVDIILCDYDLGNGYDGLHLLAEIKEKNLIKQSCVFMIVTGERRAQRVIGAAELSPDGYVLKPFTGEQLRVRLERAMIRKEAMKCVDDFMLRHEYLAAIAECDKKILAKDEYTIDFMKLKGSLCLKIGDHLGAKSVYEQILAVKPLAWAQMGLGKCLTLAKQYDEAAVLFNEVIKENDQIMEAYDWLAKIHHARQEFQEAQQVTERAVELSPVVLHRQKALSEAAVLNGDYETATKAMNKTIDIAKYSTYRCAEDYANLARLQRLKGDMEEALQTASVVRREFRGDPVAKWMADLVESQIQKQMGNPHRARELLDQAVMQYQDLAPLLSQDAQLELVHASYQQDRDDIGQQVVEKLVKNNHDNEEVLDKIATVFRVEGREADGLALIAENVQSVVDLNNDAVRLAQSGKLEEAVSMFIKAVEELPSNSQIMLNAVNAILGFVHQKGWHESYIAKAHGYLDKVRKQDPTSGKYQKLLQAYRTLVQKHDKREWLV